MTPNELPMEELLTTLAEESAELAQASLKLRRCLTQINPTPKSYEICIDNILEEIGDVQLCLQALGFTDGKYTDQINAGIAKKINRWTKRLTEKYNQEEKE